MSHALSVLEPQKVFDYFYQITQVPRPSKKEEQIRAYVMGIAKNLGLPYSEDASGNIVIKKGATSGYEDRPVVVLQGHLDMVCQHAPGVTIDFEKDPIVPRIDGDYVKATGTTLGADNGIAVATMLALLEDTTFAHGPLEMLFTIDEETGLTGATKLDPKLISGRIMLNLDSEEEGTLFIGCAGGKDGILSFPAKWKEAKGDWVKAEITVSGGFGGHSGLDIHMGRANANKSLIRVLYELQRDFSIRVSSIKGGTVRNAIPRDAMAVIGLPSDELALVKKRVQSVGKLLVAKHQTTDPDLKITIHEKPADSFSVMRKSDSIELIRLLKVLPNGVMAMSKEMPGLVETSCNLATIETTKQGVTIGMSHRSAIESEKRDLVDQVTALCSLTQAEISETDGYPGWKPDPQSKLLAVTKSVFTDIYGKVPAVTAIHAGLECGIIGEKFGEMDMISFGPTMHHVHSPDEKLYIPSVKPFYESVKKLLGAIV